MKTKILFLGLMLFSILTYTQSIPDLINYQGKITDSSGMFINNNVDLTFRMFDVETGGSALWEETQTGVKVSDGYFHVLLGMDSAFPAGLFSIPNLWLSTEVNNDGEMTPRSRLASVPYSHNAGNGVPVGAIMPYMGINPPAGWLLCNGQSIATGEEFSALRAMIGDTVPDLRGEFLRGLDAGRGIDPDGSRSLGSVQTDAFQDHKHNDTGHNHNFYDDAIAGPGAAGGGILGISNFSYPDITEISYALIGGPVANLAGDPRLSSETRPHNVAVNFIIKY